MNQPKVYCKVSYQPASGGQTFYAYGWHYTEKDAFKDATFQIQEAMDAGKIKITNTQYSDEPID